MIDLSTENADYLAQLQRAVVREQAIRTAMAETGETREVIAESLDAMGAMDQEAVLELTEGQPTTLRDALTRYIRITAQQGEPSHEIGAVLADLSAILEYPWRDEEALVALHEPNAGLVLGVNWPDDEHMEIVIGENRWPVASANHDEHGNAGMALAEEVARAVHRAVLVRVLADRDHHVQLNDAERQALIGFLERPNGSWTGQGRLSVDAVSGGGVLVRTRPYSYQRPGPALARQQELADQRRGVMPTVDGIRGHREMTPEEVEQRRAAMTATPLAPWCGNDTGPRDAYATPQQIAATDPGDLPAQG